MVTIERRMHRDYDGRGRATGGYVVSTVVHKKCGSETEAARYLLALTLKEAELRKVFEQVASEG